MKGTTRHYNLLLCVSISLLCLVSNAQQVNNLRSKSIELTNDTIRLDTLSIVPGSISFPNLDSLGYELLFAEGKILFEHSTKKNIIIQYRVLPFNISAPAQHRILNNNQVGPSFNPYNFSPAQTASTESIFGENALNKNGSISRGINFGNNRDLSVSSNMNLQLTGKIQDIEIAAAITDNNIPIQPEGNTQQLQDFDQVYVQFSKNGHQLIAGDYQLIEQEDEFLRFNKKTQGINYTGKYQLAEEKDLAVGFSAALSRGKFGRNVVIGTEGNQGPYQLKGTENEQFIIVLSGTEKVYIDGELMKRGMDNDYIINYNAGEITFTNNQLITKDKRITVEFQYSDRNYSRTLFSSSNKIDINKKTKIGINFYSEQDMKFQQLLQTLTEDDIALLNAVGDSTNQAVIPKIDSVEFSSALVLYEQVDSVVDGINYSLYRYSTDEEKAHFQLSFSNVGQGNGNYVQENSSVNGRVFSWIAPINGVAQGQYEPVVQIVSPKQQQMATVSLEHTLTEKQKIFIETAVSNNNKNLFSNKNKADDQGVALREKYSFTIGNPNKKWGITGEQTYSLINKNFSAIERFRSVEFERDWNTTASEIGRDEHFVSISLQLKKDKIVKSSIGSSFLNRIGGYQGTKNDLSLNLNLWKGAKIEGAGSFVSAKDQLSSSQFLRHKFALKQQVSFIEFKIWEQQENKLFKLNGSDSLLSGTSNDYFNLFGAEITSGEKKNAQVALSYSHRFDYLPTGSKMKLATVADDYGLGFQHQNKKRTSVLKLKSSLRQLQIVDTLLSNLNPENTFLNRIEYSFSLLKGFITSKSFFEIGTGNELKREFTYVEVAAGQGIYTWNDYNGDGIQQLNEFEITPYTDQKKYIRVFLPSTEFIRTFTNQLTQSLNINPAKYLKRDKKAKRFITRFSDQSYLRLNQKNAKETSNIVNVPFETSISDSSLISINSALRNTIYFNRSNPVFGANYSISDSRNKTLLLHGYDARRLYSQEMKLRWNLFKVITLQLKLEDQQKSRSSEVFSSDDYHLQAKIAEPKIQFQNNSKFRFTIKGSYKDKQNDENLGNESSIYQNLGAGLNYSIPGKGRLNLEFDYINTTFSAEDSTSSPLQFEMLEGLQIGNNYTWTLRYQQSFKNNLQANITYEGRSSPGFKVIHTGGLQIQLLF